MRLIGIIGYWENLIIFDIQYPWVTDNELEIRINVYVTCNIHF